MSVILLFQVSLGLHCACGANSLMFGELPLIACVTCSAVPCKAIVILKNVLGILIS